MKGKTLFIEIGSEKFECDLTSFVLEKTSPPDTGTDGVITFCDASNSAGGNIWVATLEGIQSTDTSAGTAGQSLHTLIWDTAAAGGGDLAFVFAPFNNATATAEQPHFTGTLVIESGAYPTVGGSAGDNSFTWTGTYVVKGDTVTRKTA